MAEVDGKVVMKSPEGRLYRVAPADVATAAQNQGWQIAGDEEVAARQAEREAHAQYGSTGQQALGALETFTRTATMGAVPGFGSPEDVAGRSAVLRKESPVTSFLSQAAGTVVPALAGGALAEGAAGALGAGELALPGALGETMAVPTAAAPGLLTGARAVGEGLSASSADELEEARATSRPVNVGNILMNTIGGEIIGRAVPAIARETSSALRSRLFGEAATTGVEAAGEGVLGQAERHALDSSADVADGLPHGPDRDVFLANADQQITDRASQRMAGSLDELNGAMGVGGAEKPCAVNSLVEKTHPAQRDWAADTSQAALDLREEIRAPSPKPEGPTWLPREGEAMPGPAAEPVGIPKDAGLGKFTKELDRTLTDASESLDHASTNVEYFQAGRDLHADLAAQERKIQAFVQSGRAADPEAAQALLDKVGTYRQNLRQDLERPDLWGQAGEYQRRMNSAIHDNWVPGSNVVEKDLGRTVDGETRFDPSKVRSHLKADEVGRGLTPEFLERKLQGAEQAIDTHKQFGTASDAQIHRMETAVKDVRDQLKLADDVRGAKARMAEQEGLARESAKFDREQAGAERERKAAQAAADRAASEKSAVLGDILSSGAGMAAGAIAHSFGLGAAVAAGSKLLRLNRLLETLGRTGEATVGSAARGAVRGGAGPVLRSIEGGLGKAATGAVPVATTALARFQGEYPSLQSAFDARRRAVETIQQNPIALHDAIGKNFGSLPMTHPELFGQISARLQVVAQYLHDNLPAQLSASMVRPNGIPLSRATARDFALKYNSATNPASVLDDVKRGMASPTQIRTLEAVHPDIYQNLKLAITSEVAKNPEGISTQRKLRLDILFGGDGMAGRAFAWPLAKAVKDYRAGRSTGALAASPAPSAIGKTTPSRGLDAIKSSVTNA